MTKSKIRLVALSALLYAAAALGAPVGFSIPAGEAGETLKHFGEQAQLQLLFASQAVEKHMTREVRGELEPQEALKRLLEGSGLTFEFVNERTVAVREEGANASASEGERGMRKAQAEGGSDASEQNVGKQEENAVKLEEIIVTATKRKERLQDVPMSITAITASEINQRGLVGAADYLRGIPGVSQIDDGSGNQTIIIRGMETTPALQNNGSGPTTATYFGEMPTTTSAGLIGGSSVDLKLVDIDRVEVLRGPQGTAFGSSSMGGAVRIIPMAPKLDRIEGKVGAGYSATSGTGGNNYNFQAVGNFPLISDRFAIRATAYKYQDSGFYRNDAGSNAAFQAVAATPFGAEAFAKDENEAGAVAAYGGRIAALFQATDNLQFTVSYLAQKTENNGNLYATSGTYTQTLLQVAPAHVHRGQTAGVFDTNFNGVNAVVEYGLTWADLVATYSYLKSGSTVAHPFFPTAPVSVNGEEDSHERVGEMRIATKLDGAWNFLAGIYAENLDDKDDRDFDWYGSPATNFFSSDGSAADLDLGFFLDRRELKQKAAFGEVSWKFLPKFELTGGVRAFNYDRIRRIDQNGLFLSFKSTRDEIDESGTTFRGNLTYKPDDSSMLYLSWAQGFRLGKPQSPAPTSLCDKNNDGYFDQTNVTIASSGEVHSDSVDSYELGGKFGMLNQRLRVDAALFRMEWSDIPVRIQLPSCIFGFTANAGAARSEGFELAANLSITPAFDVRIGGSWLRAKLLEDVPVQNLTAGTRLPGSPDFNANLGLQYKFSLGGHDAYFLVDSIYVDKFRVSLGDTRPFSGGYVKLDTSARMTIRNLDVDLFAENLTNADEFISGGDVTGLNGSRLRPRTIGFRLGYAF